MLIDFSLLPIVLICWLLISIWNLLFMILKVSGWFLLLALAALVGLILYAGSVLIDEALKAMMESES